MVTPRESHSSQVMSSIDHAWLRMEHPTNLMIITVVLTTRTPFSYEQIEALLEQRLSIFERLRQRVDGDHWVDCPGFDFHQHICPAELQDPDSESEFMRFIGERMSEELDFSRPLWEINVLEQYKTGSALVIRLHHCIGDGIAMVNMILGMADQVGSVSENAPGRSRQIRRPKMPTNVHWETALNALQQSSKKFQQETRKLYEDPSHLLSLGERGLKFVNAWNKLAFVQNDSKTVLKGRLGVEKAATWSQPYLLEAVKQAGKRHGATINDVMVSTVSGAIRRYLKEKGQDWPDLSVNIISPVNFKPVRDLTEMGNQFGLVFLGLPVTIDDPVARLKETHKRMEDIKNSPEAAISKGFISALGVSAKTTQTVAIDLFSARATAILTNVPGPVQQLSLAGADIDRAMFWVPKTGRLGLGFSVLSYRDVISLAIASDRGLVPDPERMMEFFEDEMQRLMVAS